MSVARVVAAACAAALLALVVPAAAAAASDLSWSGRFLIDPPDGGHQIRSVSCPSAHLCAAVDSDGNAFTTTHPRAGAAAWKAASIGTPLRGVACRPTLCVAVDQDGGMSSNTDPAAAAPSWSAVGPIDSGNGLMAVACPSIKLCVAVDNAGRVVTSINPTDFSQWHAAPVDGTQVIEAVSCPSTTFCVAVDHAGNALSSTNPSGGAAAWKKHPSVDSTNEINAVSCASAALCLATDTAGNILSTTTPAADTAWKAVHVDGGPPNYSTLFGVSCPSAKLCVAVDDNGDALTSRHPTGAATAWKRAHVDGRWSFLAVSCAPLPLCAAGDQGGNVVVGRLPLPNTKITAVTIDKKDHAATFKFTAVGIASGFQCELQRGTASASFARCKSPKAYKQLKAGSYKFRVRAVNSSGPDPTPASAKFSIPKTQ